MKILLVDDHALFREGLRLLLGQIDTVEDVDEAADCREALERLPASDVDIVLLDFKLPDRSGLDALGAVREARPDVPVVILSGEDAPGIVRAAIEAGAMGFVPKSARSEILISALQLILAGGVYLPPTVLGEASTQNAAPAASPAGRGTLDGLSPRQMDVLKSVIAGKPNKIVARELDITEHTVKAHLSAVFRALGVHNRTEAVYAAARLGISLPN